MTLPLHDTGLSIGRAWLDGMKQAAGVETYEELRVWLDSYIERIQRDPELSRLRALAAYRALPWYRRAWLTLTGKAPR